MKLGNLNKSHHGGTRIQTQVLMTSKHTIPYHTALLIQQTITFQTISEVAGTMYWGHRDELNMLFTSK